MAWFYVLRRLPAGTTSMSSLGIPVVALLASGLQLGERPTLSEWAGITLITIGLAIVSWDAIRRHRDVEPMRAQE
jgi:drug/metabolite transporter (DMT)-like permease